MDPYGLKDVVHIEKKLQQQKRKGRKKMEDI